MRISLWRLGLAVAATYALVLQSILLAATPVTALPASGPIPLCTPGMTKSGERQKPSPHGQHACICTFHCCGAAAPPLPNGLVNPAVFLRARVAVFFERPNTCAHHLDMRLMPPARAPPNVLTVITN